MAFLGLIALGAVVGAGLVIGTQMAVNATGTNEFCSSCHSMTIPHTEYRGTLHYANRTGIQVHCADCHIPHHYPQKLITKIIVGTKDIVQEMRGVLATEAQYAERREEMAKKVWARLQANDSAECRYCHDTDHMRAEAQRPEAREAHALLAQGGTTCIDCHQGIAHHAPGEAEVAAVESTPEAVWGQYAAGASGVGTDLTAPKVTAAKPPAEVAALLKKGLCLNCHGTDKDKTGPAFTKSAEKYRGRDDAQATVTAYLRSGEGHLAVPLNDAELERALNWVLAR
ncbi:MAG: NapC/NirT family cytochrome c [Thiotrichales bacterium]